MDSNSDYDLANKKIINFLLLIFSIDKKGNEHNWTRIAKPKLMITSYGKG